MAARQGRSFPGSPINFSRTLCVKDRLAMRWMSAWDRDETPFSWRNRAGMSPVSIRLNEGVHQATEQARKLGLKLQSEVTSIEKFDFGIARWDLIVLTYAPTKAVAPYVERALKLGGI